LLDDQLSLFRFGFSLEIHPTNLCMVKLAEADTIDQENVMRDLKRNNRRVRSVARPIRETAGGRRGNRLRAIAGEQTSDETLTA
jgi:hypothetical protein